MKKFKALVHYIINECANPYELGAIRLNKALWFSDVTAYKIDGKSITNEKYVKRQHGPAPKRVVQALRELKSAGAIDIVEPKFDFDLRKFISRQAPPSRALTNREKMIVSAVLDAVLERTASEISEMSHDQVWDAALEGEEIPFCATLAATPGEIDDEVVEWAEKAIAESNAAA